MGGNWRNYREEKVTATDAKISTPPSTSLPRLLLFMAPLFLMSVMVAVLGPMSLDWNFKFRSPWVAWISGGPVSTSPSRSPSPAHSVQFVDQPGADLVLTNDSTLNIAPPDNVNEPAIISRRDHTELDRLEAGLQKARTAIRDAIRRNQTQVQDQDYTPSGPIYRNSNAFQRSYLEMEKQFKIFVYGEGEPPLFHNGPCKSIYSSEGSFILGLEMETHFRTKDPGKAHVFLLPFSVTMLVSFVYNSSDSHGFDPVRRTVADYVKVIADKYPYWNRSRGADHLMVACHDKGPKVSRAVPNLAKNSIRVLCNANTSEGFVPSKDVSLPEINLVTGNAEGFIGGPSASERTMLAFFAGGVHGRIRPILLLHWENKDPDMRVHRYLPKGVSYYEMMKKSKFCLCPSGYEVASPRVVEALYVGCVPVLLSRSYVAPFSDVLNWGAFSVIVSVEDIPNLKQILSNISAENYTRMQRRGVEVRRHFVVNFPPKRFDVYHMILHSIWLRRLNVRVHEGRQAQGRE